MRILINCSNLKEGGTLQVTDSFCGQLIRFKQHKFVVVLSSHSEFTAKRIQDYENVEVLRYNIPDTFSTIILGRDRFFDNVIKRYDIAVVLTMFGPSRWIPNVPHLSGFALAQLVITDSPFFQRMGAWESFKWIFWRSIRKWSLKRSADYFWTENPYISNKLKLILDKPNVYTVTNYYNQVFDNPTKWVHNIKLPPFDGITCLTIGYPFPHKNFGIIGDILRYFKTAHPNFKVRFVLTFDEKQCPFDDGVKDHVLLVGKVNVAECPGLYEQADIMFMPTLLESFTATYPEAMRMEVPIVTTDLNFSRGLCGDAACYYSATDPREGAEAIYKVATDSNYAKSLVENGKKQLLTYDNYEQRADKLIRILETIANENDN